MKRKCTYNIYMKVNDEAQTQEIQPHRRFATRNIKL